MWIRSQDKRKLVNTDNATGITCATESNVDETVCVISAWLTDDSVSRFILGKYTVLDRAEKVLNDIINSLNGKSIVFYMPEE